MTETVDIDKRNAARMLIETSGLMPLLEPTQILSDQPFREQVRGALEAISELPVNATGSRLRVQVSQYHIQLKKIIWDTAVTGASIALSALDPTHITKAAVATKLVHYLGTLRDRFTKLSDLEIRVYGLVLTVIQNKHESGKLLQAREASEEDVVQLIQSKGEGVPANLTDILATLVSKGALATVFHGDRITRYQVVV